MPTQFQILQPRNLVYIRHFGEVTVAGANESFSAFIAHPDMRPGQTHLADFSAVTSFENDFVGFMALQARVAGELTGLTSQTLLVLYGPSGPGLVLTRAMLRSWDGQQGMTVRMAGSEVEALDILNQPERRFSALFDPRELALTERPMRAGG